MDFVASLLTNKISIDSATVGNRMRPMPYEPFRVIPQRGAVDGLQILSAKGPITHESSSTLVDAVLAVSDPRLIIDLSEVPSLDSVAIGGLIRAYVHCQKSGRRLAFVGLNPRVTNVLRLTGVEPLFDSYATIGEAESAVA
jgi:anti-anti-sigma factor